MKFALSAVSGIYIGHEGAEHPERLRELIAGVLDEGCFSARGCSSGPSRRPIAVRAMSSGMQNPYTEARRVNPDETQAIEKEIADVLARMKRR